MNADRVKKTVATYTYMATVFSLLAGVLAFIAAFHQFWLMLIPTFLLAGIAIAINAARAHYIHSIREQSRTQTASIY